MNIGDQVKTKRGTIAPRCPGIPYHRTAVIKRFLSDIPGGVVLDRHLKGFRYWNVEELERCIN